MDNLGFSEKRSTRSRKGLFLPETPFPLVNLCFIRQIGKVSGNTCLLSGYPLINFLPFDLPFGITNHKLSWTFREYFHTILFSQSHRIWFGLVLLFHESYILTHTHTMNCTTSVLIETSVRIKEIQLY